MAAYPTNDWDDLVPGKWYELQSVDGDHTVSGRFTGVLHDDKSASFEVDGRPPGQRFWKKNYSAARVTDPYS